MSYVYFIKACGPHPAVKIGVSDDVERRLSSLQTGNHLELRLLGRVKHHDAGWLERRLHEHFADLRLEGEWFRLDDHRIEDMLSALVMLDEQNNPPYELSPASRLATDRILMPIRESSVRSALSQADWWVVEWNDAMRCIHVQPLLRSLSLTQETYLLNSGYSPNGDYRIVAICKDADEAAAVAAQLEPTLKAVHFARSLAEGGRG